MNDPYPQTIKIDIDRDRLCRYLRLQCFFGWTTTLVLFGPLFGVLLLVGEKNRNRFDSVDEFYQQMFRGLSLGAAAGLLLGVICYLVISHRRAQRTAHALQVTVEGPFLRIVEGLMFRTDRRLHFNSIYDYVCVQGPLMRWCGISRIDLKREQRPVQPVRILAAKDPIKVRDMLSEIDSIREGEKPA